MTIESYSVVVLSTPALDKLLVHHLKTCAFWIFSGDRHCSCGRDEAIEELQAVKVELEKQQVIPMLLFTFAVAEKL